MLSNFFRRLTEYEQRVNRKQNVAIDSPTSGSGQGKYMNNVSILSPPLESELPIFNVSHFCKQHFEKELIETNEIAINAES
jgi:hypothetical protein